MNVLYPVKVNCFYSLVERVCGEVGLPFRKSVFSKKMYGNVVLTFLVVYREKLNVSYRRFVEICDENNVQRMLCLKRIPHYSTLCKFVARTPKHLFEKLVRACSKLLKLKNITASIDGTGFSNQNPSHYYCNRIDGKKVKNYTKTMFLTDNKTKLILNTKTHSDNRHETLDFIPLVKEIKNSLNCVLADKAYDSKTNRNYCWKNNIEVHIPFRKYSKTRQQEAKRQTKRKQEEKIFNKTKYNYRALVESVNSAIKRTLGSWVCSRKPSTQQKQVTIKAIAYNLEIIGKTIKLTITINC